jgi:hypothetical protein
MRLGLGIRTKIHQERQFPFHGVEDTPQMGRAFDQEVFFGDSEIPKKSLTRKCENM